MLKFIDNVSPMPDQFFQRRTYLGVLEGVPNSEINNEMLQYHQAEAKRRFGLDNIFQIKPAEKTNVARPNYAALPSVTCMMELTHYQPMKNSDMECSKLCLIWYQETFAFPIDANICAQIAKLSWTEYSEDYYL